MLRLPKKWTPEVEALIGRFQALEPAEEPFELAPWAQVIDPVKFHKQLASDIKQGPEGTRARMGALAVELDLYVRVRGSR